MRQIAILIAVALTALASSAADRLYIDKFDIAAGQTVEVPVMLANGTAYSALQTDMYLTNGLEFVIDDEGVVCELTSRATNNHRLSVHPQEDGSMRVFITTQNSRALQGNSGAVFTIMVKANDKFAGNQSIALRNNVAVEVEGMKHVLDDFVLKLLSDSNPLDVNGDGSVDVGDVNTILAAILAGNYNAAYDVNGDHNVDVGDVNTILAAILKQ